MSTKTFQIILDDLKDWDELVVSGEYIIKRAHSGESGSITESTVKIRELPEISQTQVAALIKQFQCHKFEIICYADGTPDRVKISRIRV